MVSIICSDGEKSTYAVDVAVGITSADDDVVLMMPVDNHGYDKIVLIGENGGIRLNGARIGVEKQRELGIHNSDDNEWASSTGFELFRSEGEKWRGVGRAAESWREILVRNINGNEYVGRASEL